MRLTSYTNWAERKAGRSRRQNTLYMYITQAGTTLCNETPGKYDTFKVLS